METNDTVNGSTAGGGLSAPEFNGNAVAVIAVYSVLFVISAVGNLTVFTTLIRGRHRKSRITLMITHLAVADLFVTFFMIPLEISWRLTTQWLAGNAACKFFLFLRAFGLYLSSNVLVCVSVDRYFAVLHPLRVTDARRRGKMMLALAWIFSLLCALPQSVVFHVLQHPQYPDFWQCVSFGFFRSQAQETAYNLFCVFAMYFLPLFVICFAYSCILWEISKKTRETRGEDNGQGSAGRTANGEALRGCGGGGRLRLRRSDMTNIERARARTLRMTITIVAAFIWCWTPYVVMTLWYMFDRESAMRVDSRLQDVFFIMAVSNSCMNPIVYGSYAMNFRTECCGGWCAQLYTSHNQLVRKSTDGVRNARAVFCPSKCVVTLIKGVSWSMPPKDGGEVGPTRMTHSCPEDTLHLHHPHSAKHVWNGLLWQGSGVTRSTGAERATAAVTTHRNQYKRPYSVEELVPKHVAFRSECHSDPGAASSRLQL